MDTLLQIPQLDNAIAAFSGFQIAGKPVHIPYFINSKKIRGELAAQVGKGSPEELEMEVKIYSKLRGFDLRVASAAEIRDFMKKESFGIDCSGFVSNVYQLWLHELKLGSISNHMRIPPENLLSRIKIFFRFIPNLSADTLTSNENCFSIEVKDVLPGDLIRMRSIRRGFHVLLIDKILKNELGEVKEISYINSTPFYEPENGIRRGTIRVIDQYKPLEEQEWLDFDKEGKNPSKEGYLVELADNGIRRPKFLFKNKMQRS